MTTKWCSGVKNEGRDKRDQIALILFLVLLLLYLILYDLVQYFFYWQTCWLSVSFLKTIYGVFNLFSRYCTIYCMSTMILKLYNQNLIITTDWINLPEHLSRTKFDKPIMYLWINYISFTINISYFFDFFVRFFLGLNSYSITYRLCTYDPTISTLRTLLFKPNVYIATTLIWLKDTYLLLMSTELSIRQKHHFNLFPVMKMFWISIVSKYIYCLCFSRISM